MASSTDYFAAYQWINPARPLPPAHGQPHGTDKTPNPKPASEVSPVSADSGPPTKKMPSLSAQVSSDLIKSSSQSTVGYAQPSTDAKPNLLSPQAESCTTTPSGKSTNEAVTPAESHTLKIFTCFPNLPFELRTMILTIACHESRIIDLWISELPFEEHGGATTYWGDRPYRWRSQAERAPGLLHTSRETRTVGLKYYTLAFETSFPFDDSQTSSMMTSKTIKTIDTPAHVWVNWDCDIMCRMHDNSDVYGIQLARHTDMKHIRRLAVEHWDPCVNLYYVRKLDLKELILMPGSNFGALSDVYDTKICNGENVSFAFTALSSENKTETFKALRLASMRMKGGAELTMKTWLHVGESKSPDEQGWKALEDWEVPKIKLMLLEVHVDGQKYEMYT